MAQNPDPAHPCPVNIVGGLGRVLGENRELSIAPRGGAGNLHGIAIVETQRDLGPCVGGPMNDHILPS